MRILSVGFVIFVALCIVTAIDTDDEDDEAVVEEEKSETTEEEDIPYTSPTPSGNYYLAEDFDNIDKFKKKWILSEAKKDGIDEELAKYDGVWEVQPAVRDKLYGDLGLVLKSQAKHAAISAKLDKVFNFNDSPLVVQYEVNFQEGQECGGAYLKLLSHGKNSIDLKQFTDVTPYTIMFGPDKCGNDHKLHFIFRHKNPNNGSFEEKHCKKPKDRLEDQFKDKHPHLYTLILHPDNTFLIKVDHKIVNQGSLLEDFTPSVNPEAEIDDPNDVKPDTWDEREKIPDPNAKKPDDWDEDAPTKIIDQNAKKPDDWLEDEPAMIPDPAAEKPDDWDSDMDGEWEAPLVDNPLCETVSGCGPWEPPSIDNPAYKGKWRPSYIDNPSYQGKWKPRKIPNPNFFHDAHPFRMTSIAAVGFELWSMSPMIQFDNIIVTDSIEVAEDYASKTYDLKKRKIDKDSVTMIGRILRSINYYPKTWATYFLILSIPIMWFAYIIYSQLKEEGIITRFLKFSNERPYLYAVYIVAIGLPVALICVFCCSDSNKENAEKEKEAEAKKTDAFTPDEVPKPAKSKSQLEVPNEVDAEEEEEDEGGEDEDEDEEAEAEGDDQGENSADNSQEDNVGQGDSPPSARMRKARARKE